MDAFLTQSKNTFCLQNRNCSKIMTLWSIAPQKGHAKNERQMKKY